MPPRRILMMDALLNEMGEALHDALTYLDDLGFPEPIGDWEEAEEYREAVMERIADVLSCYKHKDYEVVDGEVVWPEET